MMNIYHVDGEISVGRKRPCDIVASEIQEMSANHLKIVARGSNAKAYIAGKNGVYINGSFVRFSEMVEVEFGDEISLFGIRILWLCNVIAVRWDEGINISISLNEIEDEADLYDSNDISSLIKQQKHNECDAYFSKAPRTIYHLNQDVIELEAPPEKHIEERQPLLVTIGPAFTMALPMMAGFFVSKIAAGNNGSSSPFMYMGIITAISSAILGVVWGSINIKNKNEQILRNERRRRTVYTQYVSRSEAKIKELYNKNVSNLRLMYPDFYEYVPEEINRLLLWNRRVEDSDFLKVRLGISNIPYDINVSIPKDRFSLVEDELKNLPARLKNEYSILRDVPETVDLLENKIVGVICENKRFREETFLELATTLAVTISPTDLQIDFRFFNDLISEECKRKLRFLPHIDSTNEAPYAVVFTDNYSKAKNNTECENTSFIIIQDTFENLPSECRFIIQRETHFSGYLNFSKDNSIRRTIHFDRVEPEDASRISRLLQSVKYEKGGGKYMLPEKISFLDLYEKDITNDVIIHNWNNNDTSNEIQVPIGISEDGKVLILDLHERGMGPHGLIAGMTGSGKSEILQTIILSLIINYSSEEIGLFLIDYKGGGMSKLFEGIPHLMGSISNLSGRMIYRAMASVKSENTYRQKCFMKASVNNIYEYQRLYRQGIISEPLPHVFIIIDEFAELKREEPEFMKELVSVARVGRSLGVHLILATQKPTGVVDDNIFSNSRFRICLKLQDRQDSMEMLKRKDAADITNPGRAILQVGNDEIFCFFQGAYTMDTSEYKTKKKQLLFMDSSIGMGIRNDLPSLEEEESIPQLKRIIEEIEEVQNERKKIKRRPLWLEPLKSEIYYTFSDTDCYDKRFCVRIGIFDDPKNQRQGEVKLNLNDMGNLIILGGLQSGKSTLLATISLSLIQHFQNDYYNFFYIDFSSGILRPFEGYLGTGGFISEENEEDIEKVIIKVKEIIARRKEILKGGSFSQYIEKRSIADSDYLPYIVFVIDGIGAFRERSKGIFDKELEGILKVSASLGIIVIATANNISSAEISKRMFDCFKTCIPLSLRDKYEYKDALGINSSEFIMPEAVKGRGLLCIGEEICEFQAFQTVRAVDDFERANALKECIKEANMRFENSTGLVNSKLCITRIPVVPKDLTYEKFLEELCKRNEEEKGIPIGFFIRSGETYFLPYEKDLVVVISGRAGSGKSSLLKVISSISENEISFENDVECIEFENGMKVFVYDDNLSFDILSEIKKEAGQDPYVIHLGGGIDRQNLADFSYIPYSAQIQITKPGRGVVRKTTRGYENGEVIFPEWKGFKAM